jgi:hypothetical protein
MIGHQTVTEQLEGITALGLPQGVKKSEVVHFFGENVSPVVSTIERVVDQSIMDSAWQASHMPRIRPSWRSAKKNELTPISSLM